MKIGTILNSKKDKDVVKSREVIGKNKKAGNFSFAKVQANKAKKVNTED